MCKLGVNFPHWRKAETKKWKAGLHWRWWWWWGGDPIDTLDFIPVRCRARAAGWRGGSYSDMLLIHDMTLHYSVFTDTFINIFNLEHVG